MGEKSGSIRVMGFGCGLLLLVGSLSAFAAPFRPSDDSYVLERLPFDWADAESRALQKMRDSLRRHPNDLTQAIALAKGYIHRGRAESDPRYYGYAQAALAPWLNRASPPIEALLLRATFKQNAHDFDGALSDLSHVLKSDPNNAQAWVTRATILQVQGRYKEAKQGCLALLPLTTELVVSICVASVGSVNGEAEKSYALLKGRLEHARHASRDERLWALTSLAEMAARMGKPHVAENHFQAAFSLKIRDVYLLTAYADFLLDSNQPEKVAALLKGESRVDGLLLRQALAKKQAGALDLSDDRALLRARFEASRMRADTRHLREEALFTLKLLNQPQKALALAAANWAVQKEPMDTRILLESAIAADDFKSAEPVLRWIREARTEDVNWVGLVKRLEKQ